MCRVSRRASGGTLAAFLIFAAIVGFSGGAYLGTQTGDADPAVATSDETGTVPPADESGGNDGGDEEPTEDPTEPADGELTFSLAKDSAAPNEQIDYSAQLSSGEEGVTLQVQRSIDGSDWEDFPITRETNENGEVSGYLQTGRSGENSFRVVRADDDSVVSEPAVVTIE